MSMIEPNIAALLWFSVLWTVCCVAFFVLSGMFPLDARPDRAKRPGGTVLVIGNALLLAVLMVGTGRYGYEELRWTTLIIAGGVIFLFAPILFEAWPERWRDGRAGLAVVLGLLAGSLAFLNHGGRDAFGL